jgi:hypothetical protein
MTDRGTVPFGVTKDTYAWFAKLPTSLRPSLRKHHYLPRGFGQKMASFSQGNSQLASDMYAGRFVFKGKTISASPSEVFSKIDTQLEWLSHFNASNRGLHDQYAMRLLHYWSKANRSKPNLAAQAQIIFALATDGQMIARRCQASVQTSFFEIAGREVKKLAQTRARNSEQSMAKAIALLYCLNSFQGLGHLRELAYELIERNLDHVILPDGGHASYKLPLLLEFLQYAVPLTQVSSAIMPPMLLRAIENGLALLKMVQSPDGKLSGLIIEIQDTALLQSLLNVESVEIANFSLAPRSGFARIEHEKATLIANTSACLGLDFADGNQRLMKSGLIKAGQMLPADMQSAPQGTVLMMQSASKKRTCFLSADGQDLRVEDECSDGDISIQVAQGIRLSSLMEGQAVMFVMPDQSVWHLKQRGGSLDIRQFNMQSEIIIHHKQKGPINWSLKKQAKANKTPRKKQSIESGLLI